MDELNDLYMKDAEIDRQIFMVLRDVVNEGIEYMKDEDNRDSVIGAAIPPLNTILDEEEKAIENKIKSNVFNKNPKKMPQVIYQKVKIGSVYLYRLIRELLKGYELKKEFFGEPMKKLNDYLKNHMNFKNVDLKGIKFGIGIWDTWVFIKNVYNIWVKEDRNLSKKLIDTRKEILKLIGQLIFGCIGENIGVALFRPLFMKVIAVLFLAYFLSEFGGWLFEKLNDILSEAGKILAGIAGDNDDDDHYFGIGFFRRKKDDDDDDNDGGDPPFPPCPAFAMAMRSGGVEFHFPKQINNFTSFFSFNKCHYIAFEYEDLNIQEIIDLVNRNF